jgi:dTDP-4-amino-4,6-dideoxygalactose transaminase
VASANCGRYCGAAIDFVDIDAQTFNMCPNALDDKLRRADHEGTLPKVIVVVHMCGQSPEMERIASLARAYGIKIIEDASHAVGARYRGKPVGCGEYSDVTVFSFHPVKIITTAEGGAALTNNKTLADRMRSLRSHGIIRDEALMTTVPDGPWYYQQQELGFNYRMSDIQAALGVSQLEMLDDFLARRQKIADRYDELLAELPLDLPGRLTEAISSWHLYVVRIHESSKHLDTFRRLRAEGINVNLHYIPVHLHPYYQELGFRAGDYPVSEHYYSRAISIPIYPEFSGEQQRMVSRSIAKALLH